MIINKVNEDLINHFSNKPSYSKKEILEKVIPIFTNIQNYPNEKVKVVKEIKKYDVLYLKTIGMLHYVLVHEVTEKDVHGVVISSKERNHSLLPLVEDRFFEGSFATSSYLTFDLDFCLGAFARVYESKKEADKVFKLVKAFYKKRMKKL